MSKRQFALGFLFISIFCAGLVTQETDSEQIHTDINKANIVEEWQSSPEAFAKLFFGNDLRVRSPGKGITILRENAERVKGSRQASVLVPGGEYDAFFQYAADPESLYQGDRLHVLSSGVEIR